MKVMAIQDGGRGKWVELPEGGLGPHSHSVSGVSGLWAILDGKADVHEHDYEALGAVGEHEAALNPHPGYLTAAEGDGSYEPLGAVSTHAGLADPHSVYQRETEKAVANGYAGLGSTALVPAGQLGSLSASATTVLHGDGRWAVPAGGSDPWSYVRLTVDASISAATAQNLSLAFTPAANERYEFEGQVYLRTATATVNPRLGLAWATGLVDGVACIDEAQSATARLMANGNINAALLIAVGGIPNTTQSWPALVRGSAIAGSSPSGTIRLQLASETAGTVVVAKAGSFLKYRLIP